MVSGPYDYLACLNPAIAFGTSFEQTYAGESGGWSRGYIYFPVPFIGSILAVIFHEFVYKKVLQTVTESESGHENQIEDEDDHVDGLLDSKSE